MKPMGIWQVAVMSSEWRMSLFGIRGAYLNKDGWLQPLTSLAETGYASALEY